MGFLKPSEPDLAPPPPPSKMVDLEIGGLMERLRRKRATGRGGTLLSRGLLYEEPEVSGPGSSGGLLG